MRGLWGAWDMADITPEQFKTRFPEFQAQADPVVAFAIEEAYALTDVVELATYYAIAHVLKLKEVRDDDEDLPGEITENKVGPITTKHKAQAKTARQVYFTRTEYGRQVLALESRSAAARIRVGIG